MYQLTNNPNMVVDLDSGAWITVDSGTWQAEEYAAWLAEGNTPAAAPALPPMQDPTSAEYQFATRAGWVQTWLDETAQQNYYRDADTCISYLGSPNEVYAADADSMNKWRSDVWPAFNAMPAGWPSDPTQWPLWDAIQPLLPQPETYGWAQHDPVSASGTAARGSAGAVFTRKPYL